MSSKNKYLTLGLQTILGIFIVFVSTFFWANKSFAYEAHVVGVTAMFQNYVCGDGNLNPGEECDDGNNSNGDGCSATCVLEKTPSCMKINEVYYDPDDAHGGGDAEWIELYNACGYQVNLKNWYLKDNTKTETIHQNYIINPDQFVVLAPNASIWEKYWDITPTNAIKIALGGGQKMFDNLANDGDRVFLYDNHDNGIDAVSWGTDTTAFDPNVPGVAEGYSIARIVKGVDTDKAADWTDLTTPNPGTNPHSTIKTTIPEPPKLPTSNLNIAGDSTPTTTDTIVGDATDSTPNNNLPTNDSTPATENNIITDPGDSTPATDTLEGEEQKDIPPALEPNENQEDNNSAENPGETENISPPSGSDDSQTDLAQEDPVTDNTPSEEGINNTDSSLSPPENPEPEEETSTTNNPESNSSSESPPPNPAEGTENNSS